MRRLIIAGFFLLLLGVFSTPVSAFTRVQGCTPGGTACQAAFGASAFTCALPAAVTSGNFVWGEFYADFTTGNTLAVTDDKSNTYNVSLAAPVTGNAKALYIYWLGNITNAPTTITGTITPTAQGNWLGVCEEWSGVNASSNPADVAIALGNTQASPGTATDGITSLTEITVTNGDLLLGATVNTTTTALASAGTGFTASPSTYNVVIGAAILESKVQSTAGAGTVSTFTQAVNNGAITYLLAVKPPGGGGPTCGARALIGVGC